MTTIMRVVRVSRCPFHTGANRLSGDYNSARVLPGHRVPGPAAHQALRLQANPPLDDDAVGHCVSVLLRQVRETKF